jgi:hypothetical protein
MEANTAYQWIHAGQSTLLSPVPQQWPVSFGAGTVSKARNWNFTQVCERKNLAQKYFQARLEDANSRSLRRLSAPVNASPQNPQHLTLWFVCTRFSEMSINHVRVRDMLAPTPAVQVERLSGFIAF